MKAIPFGRYLLTQKLALGGTAEIFRAKLLGVEGFEREVVIKRILPPWSANPEFISMLIDEAKILVKLQNERVVQVYELGKEDNLYYISMEYVKGWDLRQIIRQAQEKSERFSISECIHILSEILKGLDYIHKQCDKQGHNLEIVNRDISPQNILISSEGKIKITDFGIAHARSRSVDTSTGVIKGKFSYMSPEQARAENVDFKTDLFACGILFYELLTTQKLFTGKSDLKILDEVRAFKSANAFDNLILHPLLLKILKRSLAEDPQNRYSSAEEFLKDLQDASERLHEKEGKEVFFKRLQKLAQPQEEKEEDKLKDFDFLKDLGETNAIVSRELNSDTHHEITRSLENIFVANTDRNPSLTPFPHPKNKSSKLFLILLAFCALGLSGYFYFKIQNSRQARILRSPSPPLEPVPESNAESFTLNPHTETKSTESSPAFPAPKNEVQKNLVIPEKGFLSVRAMPWGKISVSGVASNVEKPLLRKLPYGNYFVRVSYQNDNGEWSQLSQSVKIAKESTSCNANFHPNGTGKLICR